MIALSPESYELLKAFNQGHPDTSLYNEACIGQLVDHSFIQSHISDYDLSGSVPVPCFSDYTITENGKGYIELREYNENFQASIRKIADSAKRQAEIAESNAVEAKKEAMKAKIISIIAILVALADPFLSAYATKIVQLFSELISK